MKRDLQQASWAPVCNLDQIVPNTGVAALFGEEQVAVFRLGDDAVYAINNFDPNSGAAVISRGLVGSLGERIVVASPIYKQHFDLTTGECLEEPEHSVLSYPAKVEAGKVWVAL